MYKKDRIQNTGNRMEKAWIRESDYQGVGFRISENQI
jgi:hypothetical protein